MTLEIFEHMKIKVLTACFIVFTSFVLSFTFSCSPLKEYKISAKGWEADIRKFEKLDSSENYPANSVLFMGSSSIRLWNSLPEDMKPYSVIQRGFGGAKISDLAYYTPRIVYPHQCSAIVMFVANDITGSVEDKTPKEIASLFRYIVNTIRKKLPETPIFYVAVTPTESRWKVWPTITEGNQLVKKQAQSLHNVYFIETGELFLNSEEKPNAALFLDDKLHLNAQGYKVWTAIIKEELNKVLKK